MKIMNMTACALTALVLMGCATHQIAGPLAWHFDYRSEQRVDGVIRAFDNGHQAIVQFVDLERSRPMFIDQSGGPLEYEIRGQYAVLPQIVPRFTVRTTAGAATFDYQGVVRTAPEDGPQPEVTTPAPAAPAFAPVAAVAAPETAKEAAELQSLRDQIAQARKELAAVQEELRAARETRPLPEVMRVRFAPNSHAFVPDSVVAAELLDAARRAGSVFIVGHTDNIDGRADKDAPADKARGRVAKDALALARAEDAKAFLVRHGVDAAKIAVATNGDRQPVAANLTPEHRAMNRRVDVSFAK
ncbi:MAG: OmpA family protein [Pseudomonadota bacterium]|nr:OmpA family protein [Pseudomonadota bacterium]